MLRLPNALKKVREGCYSAARGGQAKPYDGRVVLFRASEKGLSSVNQEIAWKKIIPQIEFYEVSGHHGNIVDLPQVELLAAKLKRRLELAFKDTDQPVMRPPKFTETNSEGRLELA